MKILYYFADNKSYMSQWQHEHIFEELFRHEIQIEVYNPLEYSSLNEANEKLIVKLKKDSKYDLFMNCCSSQQLFKSTMQEIKNISIPSLLICFDNLHAAYIHKDIMPYFDLVWLTSWENEKLIKSWGVNTVFLPYAANPYKFVPNLCEDISRICFIGTPYGSRINKINALLKHEIPVDLFFGNINNVELNGQIRNKTNLFHDTDLYTFYNYLKTNIGRKLLYSRFLAFFNQSSIDFKNSYLNRGYSLPFEEMINNYSSYALSLNITELRNTALLKSPIHKLHLRTFEIPMCGGLQFTSYTEELSHYFEDNKEIVLYSCDEEYIDKAKYYIADSRYNLRSKMKIAARQRAENEHTWWNRFKKIFDLLNISYG